MQRNLSGSDAQFAQREHGQMLCQLKDSMFRSCSSNKRGYINSQLQVTPNCITGAIEPCPKQTLSEPSVRTTVTHKSIKLFSPKLESSIHLFTSHTLQSVTESESHIAQDHSNHRLQTPKVCFAHNPSKHSKSSQHTHLLTPFTLKLFSFPPPSTAFPLFSKPSPQTSYLLTLYPMRFTSSPAKP